VRFLFANPADVAYADQAAAALPGTTVRVFRPVPVGWMYLVRGERLGDAANGVELAQIAEQVIEVATSTPPGAP
jgi:hypothetical protein